eukprot:3833080-Alexandrium_andersonii.AAC.1
MPSTPGLGERGKGGGRRCRDLHKAQNGLKLGGGWGASPSVLGCTPRPDQRGRGRPLAGDAVEDALVVGDPRHRQSAE